MLSMSLPPCCRYHPAGVNQPYRSGFGCPCCLRPTVAGSASGNSHFRGHLCVHLRYGPVTRSHPKRIALSMGFRYSVSLLPAIQATGLLIVTLTGLTPAEHTSLSWTHNRACGFLPPQAGLPRKISPIASVIQIGKQRPSPYVHRVGIFNSYLRGYL